MESVHRPVNTVVPGTSGGLWGSVYGLRLWGPLRCLRSGSGGSESVGARTRVCPRVDRPEGVPHVPCPHGVTSRRVWGTTPVTSTSSSTRTGGRGDERGGPDVLFEDLDLSLSTATQSGSSRGGVSLV